jgi:prephenate dehydratase
MRPLMTSDRYDAAYQGAPGAYSEQAAWNLIGETARLLPCRTLVDMFDAVATGQAARAVLPIENTLAGTVPRAYELLMERGLLATAETRVHIDHVLIGRIGADISEIRRVLSHPVALDQCRRFFTHHDQVEPVAVFDTAGAVELALQDQTGATAAIASRRAAALHQSAVLAENIQDHEQNWTRFLLVGPDASVPRGPHLILTFWLAHEPGALATVLTQLADQRANVTKLESRPIEGRPFEYAFIVELTVPAATLNDDTFLSRLRPVTRKLTLLGAY